MYYGKLQNITLRVAPGVITFIPSFVEDWLTSSEVEVRRHRHTHREHGRLIVKKSHYCLKQYSATCGLAKENNFQPSFSFVVEALGNIGVQKYSCPRPFPQYVHCICDVHLIHCRRTEKQKLDELHISCTLRVKNAGLRRTDGHDLPKYPPRTIRIQKYKMMR
jgi:hypothetical protein